MLYYIIRSANRNSGNFHLLSKNSNLQGHMRSLTVCETIRQLYNTNKTNKTISDFLKKCSRNLYLNCSTVATVPQPEGKGGKTRRRTASGPQYLNLKVKVARLGDGRQVDRSSTESLNALMKNVKIPIKWH